MLVKDLGRNKNRIKSALYFNGVPFPEAFKTSTTHWSKRFMSWLAGLTVLEPSAKESLDIIAGSCLDLRKKLLEVNKKIKKLSQTDPNIKWIF